MAVFTKNLRKHIFVHPGDQQKLHNAIKAALLKDRKKYQDSLDGALLDVNKIKVLEDRYLVVNGYLSMEVIADFEVFSPAIGMTLEGVINKVNKGHYGCLVMDLFYVSLSVEEGSNLVPMEGDACSFKVTKLVVDGDLLFMRGQLLSITPAARMDGVETALETTQYADVNSNNIAAIEIKTEKPDSPQSNDDDTHNESRTKHKKKKRKFDEIEVKTEKASDDDCLTKSPKKHKRKHNSNEESTAVNSDIALGISESSNTDDISVRNKQEKIDESQCEDDYDTPDKSRKKHKKKKRNKDEDEIDIKREEFDDDEYLTKSSKKHKKKHKDVDGCEETLNTTAELSDYLDVVNTSIKQEKGMSFELEEMTENGSSASPKKHKKKHKSKHLKEEVIDQNYSTSVMANAMKIKKEPMTPTKK